MDIIAIDAMGGDNAPGEIVKGAVDSLHMDVKILLVGKEDIVAEELSKYSYNKNQIETVHAPEVVKTDEAAFALKKKKDSSLMTGINLLRENHAKAFISAGSTGALLTGATIRLKRLKGISRPALATLLPTAKGFCLLIDSGANVDCKAAYLHQFAVLGSVYMEHAMKISNPTVALANIGPEKDKGNALTKEAAELLEAGGLNFTGNIEARDIAQGVADVVVCDGFVGNIILKTGEGYSKFIFNTLKAELTSSPLNKLGALIAKGAFGNIKKRFDYTEVGGAPFLGLSALVVKTHGSAGAKDIIGAVRQSKEFISNNIIGKMEEVLG